MIDGAWEPSMRKGKIALLEPHNLSSGSKPRVGVSALKGVVRYSRVLESSARGGRMREEDGERERREMVVVGAKKSTRV